MNPFVVGAVVGALQESQASERDRTIALLVVLGFSFAFALLVGGIGLFFAWLGV